MKKVVADWCMICLWSKIVKHNIVDQNKSSYFQKGDFCIYPFLERFHWFSLHGVFSEC